MTFNWNFLVKIVLIYHGDIPVGMILIYDCDKLGGYDFSQLFIDKRYQRKGYGLQAAQLALEWMRADKKYNKVYLCYKEEMMLPRKCI